ncbi:MAG TPA: hypothetical protein VMU94_14955 [Streptosporangiaceae bacterium]|nr:hypothetical protein [Streptosporangiaceae bacterium]
MDDGDGCGCALFVRPGGVLPALFVGAGELLGLAAGDVGVADGDGDLDLDERGPGEALRLDDAPVDPGAGWPDVPLPGRRE